MGARGPLAISRNRARMHSSRPMLAFAALCICLCLGCAHQPANPPAGTQQSVELDGLMGLPFMQARALLVASGWELRATAITGPFGPERERLSAGYFLGNGIEEIEGCSGTGLDPCTFNYRRAGGDCLRLHTEGERESATVSGVTRECPP